MLLELDNDLPGNQIRRYYLYTNQEISTIRITIVKV